MNPIIDWSDRDVGDFIHAENIPYCQLYNEGRHRLGCIGCPMATKETRSKDFIRWPKYKAMYMRAFDRMIEERKKAGLPAWRAGGQDREGATARDVFRWWREEDSLTGQMEIEDLMGGQDDDEN